MKITILLLTVFIYLPAFANELQNEQMKEYPFAKGVSQEDREASEAIYREGTNLLHDALFVDAAEKLREALKRCKCHHPAIHYNLAMALVNLDRPIEMHQQLTDAVNNGLELLNKERFVAAKNHLLFLEQKKLTRVKVKCDIPGAQVVMDGRVLFISPGQYEGLERAGPHSVVASKFGYVTNEVSKVFEAGTPPMLEMNLLTLEENIEMRRRWPKWKPFALVGAGLVVGAAGGLLEYEGHKQVSDYDGSIRSGCRTGGCPSHDSTRVNQGKTMRVIGIGATITGGAALVTGTVLSYLNRPRPFPKTSSENMSSTPKVELFPIIDSKTCGISAAFNF